MAVSVGGAADFSGAFDPYSLNRFTLVYLPAALAVVVSGAADFSGAFDTPPRFTLVYLSTAGSGELAADFSGAFDTLPLPRQHFFHAVARRVQCLQWQW
jgi:hypothetical protein